MRPHAIHDLIEIASAVVLLVVSVTWLQVYFIDRTRRAYLWLGLEALLGVAYPLALLGFRYQLLSSAHVPLLLAALCGAVACGTEFIHSIYGLPRPPRWMWVAAVGVVIVRAAVAGLPPVWVKAIGGGLGGTYLFTSLIYQSLVVVHEMYRARRIRSSPHMDGTDTGRRRPGARTSLYLLVSLIALMALAAPDLPHWIELENFNTSLGCIGVACYGLGSSLMMATEHARSLHHRDTLSNALLQRIDGAVAVLPAPRSTLLALAEICEQLAARQDAGAHDTRDVDLGRETATDPDDLIDTDVLVDAVAIQAEPRSTATLRSESPPHTTRSRSERANATAPTPAERRTRGDAMDEVEAIAIIAHRLLASDGPAVPGEFTGSDDTRAGLTPALAQALLTAIDRAISSGLPSHEIAQVLAILFRRAVSAPGLLPATELAD